MFLKHWFGRSCKVVSMGIILFCNSFCFEQPTKTGKIIVI